MNTTKRLIVPRTMDRFISIWTNQTSLTLLISNRRRPTLIYSAWAYEGTHPLEKDYFVILKVPNLIFHLNMLSLINVWQTKHSTKIFWISNLGPSQKKNCSPCGKFLKFLSVLLREKCTIPKEYFALVGNSYKDISDICTIRNLFLIELKYEC